MTTVSGFNGGTRMQYTGTDVGFGGFGGGFGGAWPGNRPENGQFPQDFNGAQGDFTLPEDFTMPEGDFQIPQQPGAPENMPSGMGGQFPGGWGGEMPEGFDGQFPGGEMPEGMDPGSFGGFDPSQMGGNWGQGSQESGQASVLFHMTDAVNAFSGVTPET